jgi:hypothetical protein
MSNLFEAASFTDITREVILGNPEWKDMFDKIFGILAAVHNSPQNYSDKFKDDVKQAAKIYCDAMYVDEVGDPNIELRPLVIKILWIRFRSILLENIKTITDREPRSLFNTIIKIINSIEENVPNPHSELCSKFHTKLNNLLFDIAKKLILSKEDEQYDNIHTGWNVLHALIRMSTNQLTEDWQRQVIMWFSDI